MGARAVPSGEPRRALSSFSSPLAVSGETAGDRAGGIPPSPEKLRMAKPTSMLPASPPSTAAAGGLAVGRLLGETGAWVETVEVVTPWLV